MSTRPRPDRSAEEEITKLCRALNGSVQKVEEDDNGWDLLVEFPPRVETAFPDSDSPLTRCLIQVKSNQSRRKSTRVKLSNALKFAKDDMPCFVALVTYPAGPKKHEAIYLRHIWATDMAEALKAAREASAGGKPLNRRHLPITFTPVERVDDLVAETILDAIGREGVDYAAKKKALSDSLGYEAGWGTGQFVLADGHDEKDLQDLMLGLRADLPIQSFVMTDVRFGITGPTKKTGPGKLSVDLKPAARCVLTVQRRDTGEQLNWTGGLFTAGMNWLPREEQRLRVSAGPMELLIAGHGKVTGDWSAPLSAPRSLEDLERDAVFRSWMDGSPLDLEVWTERGTLPTVNMNFNGDRQHEENWAEVVEAIRALSRAVPPERRPADLMASMDAFLDGLHHHTHLAAVLKPHPTTIRIVNKNELKPGLEQATHIIFPWVARFGGYFIVSIIEREITSLAREPLSLDFTTANARLLRGTAMKASDATDALVANEVQWARDRAKDGDKAVLSYHPDGHGLGTLVLSTPD